MSFTGWEVKIFKNIYPRPQKMSVVTNRIIVCEIRANIFYNNNNFFLHSIRQSS